jgi:hypothetical protein
MCYCAPFEDSEIDTKVQDAELIALWDSIDAKDKNAALIALWESLEVK